MRNSDFVRLTLRFGGATLTYSSYVYSGTYTLGTGTVTVAKANYSYNKTYTIEESGNVLVSTDGKKVLKAAGYVVENKVEQFNGYYVNGDENIEISVAKDKTVTILLNGVAIKEVVVNWNGTVLQLRNVADYDAPKTVCSSVFTIVKDGDGIKISHDCKQSYDSSYEEFETIAKSVTFTKSTKPSTGTDAFAGTWKTSDGKFSWIFDGKGNVTNEDGNSFAYTIVSGKAKFSTGALDIECTISGNTMTVSYDAGDAPFTKTFTKQA